MITKKERLTVKAALKNESDDSLDILIEHYKNQGWFTKAHLVKQEIDVRAWMMRSTLNSRDRK